MLKSFCVVDPFFRSEGRMVNSDGSAWGWIPERAIRRSRGRRENPKKNITCSYSPRVLSSFECVQHRFLDAHSL